MPELTGEGPVGNPASWIPQFMAEGYSANGALRALRDAGAGIRRQDFLRAWGEVASDLGLRQANLTRDLSSPVVAAELPTWHAGTPGRFGYTARVVLRDNATHTINTRNAMVFSDTPLSPSEALDLMAAQYTEGQGPAGYGDTLVTAYFVSAYNMAGPA